MKIDTRTAELQIVFQCAPLLSGLKISNLLIVDKCLSEAVKQILSVTDISLYCLVCSGDRLSVLLYKDKELKDYLFRKDVNQLLVRNGYRGLSVEQALGLLSGRYACYMEKRGSFPHEIGLFLGYPVEDVEGFIKNKGKNCLYTGYWKVYGNMPEKAKLFERFDYIRELMVLLACHGAGLSEIIDIFERKNN
ncbi:MAG: DUF3793 family protein [Lachnospiraceae bacterium]|nr:DUF3793 family protein [Lachnospiraceae bacterium]